MPKPPEKPAPPRPGRVNGPENGVPTPDWHEPRVHEPRRWLRSLPLTVERRATAQKVRPL